MIEFASKGINIIETELFLNLHARTKIVIFLFEISLKFREFEKYEQTNDFDVRYGLKNSRLRSRYECCCCCCCCSAAAAENCVFSMLYRSHAKDVNGRHRGAMCSVFGGRAV